MGRKQFNGNYATREELRAAIHELVLKGKRWTAIGRECGVSTTTAYNVYHGKA